MPTMNISLTDHLKEVVEKRVAEGSYSSASEYVRDLIRADERRAKTRPAAHKKANDRTINEAGKEA